MQASRHPTGTFVYRICKRFPPEFPGDYVVAASRRSFDSQSASVRRAAQGLSVFSTTEAVSQTASKYPGLGSVIARYQVASFAGFEIIHLVGTAEHLTVIGDLSRFHECLDADWQLILATIRDS
jgi:hypothetical protein